MNKLGVMPEQCLFAGDGSCDELRGAKEVTVFTSEFYNVLTTVRNCSKSTGLKVKRPVFKTVALHYFQNGDDIKSQKAGGNDISVETEIENKGFF